MQRLNGGSWTCRDPTFRLAPQSRAREWLAAAPVLWPVPEREGAAIANSAVDDDDIKKRGHVQPLVRHHARTIGRLDERHLAGVATSPPALDLVRRSRAVVDSKLLLHPLQHGTQGAWAEDGHAYQHVSRVL